MLCRQLPQAEEEKKKKPKSGKKGSKKKKGDKEGKEKEKGESKGKAKGTGEAGDEAEAPVVQAVGRHFLLQLSSEADRAVACLLAEHELQVCTDSISTQHVCSEFQLLLFSSLLPSFVL